jgi:hypothetical protein
LDKTAYLLLPFILKDRFDEEVILRRDGPSSLLRLYNRQPQDFGQLILKEKQVEVYCS